jgi:N-acetylglucosaminyldiphosphoundecaprenol N-acetyl-beta-D-mannosaminyltransferase
MFLLGASEVSSAGTAHWMQSNFPNVCVAGRHCPAFQALEEMDHEDILARIEEARPDILLVAFGNPKQEKWITMHRHRLRVPVCVGVGGSFDFLSGRIRRAPLWMQTYGMEWIYRTAQEPSRLAARYISNAAGLLCHLPGQLAAIAVQSKRHVQLHITKETIGQAIVFRVKGSLCGSQVSQFEAEVHNQIQGGSHVVLDMSSAVCLGADALGSLIHLLSFARAWKREVWLIGLSPFLRRVVRAAHLGSSFRMAPHVAEALRRIEPESAPGSIYRERFSRIDDEMTLQDA